jgi:hypothetical protein
MAIEKAKHFVYLAGALNVKIEMMVPDIYQDIAGDVGVFPPTIIYNPQLRLSVNELRTNGVIAKIRVRTESGKSHEVVCSTEKLSSALAGLVGKKIPEQVGVDVNYKKIVKVSLPRKRDRF